MLEPCSVFSFWADSKIEIVVPEDVSVQKNALENRFEELKFGGLAVNEALTQIEHEIKTKSLRERLGIVIRLIAVELELCALEGNPIALEALFYGASELTARLNTLKSWNPAVFERFARKQLVWPTLECPISTKRANLSASVKALKVGADVQDAVNRAALLQKRVNNTRVREWTAQFVQQVYDVKRHFSDPSLWQDGELIPRLTITLPQTFSITLEDIAGCLQLPPLTPSPEARGAWLAMAQRVATREAGGSFSEHPDLRAVGQQQANNHSSLSREECEARGKKCLKTLTGVAEDAIRKGMVTTLKSLAVAPDKLPAWASLQLELDISIYPSPDLPETHDAPLAELPPCSQTNHMTPAATAGKPPLPRAAKPRRKPRKSRSTPARSCRQPVASRRGRRSS